MKVLVTYMSKSGNTKKVAESIFEGIEGSKEIRRFEEVDSIEGYDLTFMGFPNHMGVDKKAAKFMEKHCVNGRRIVLFVTHAAPEDAPDLPAQLDKFRECARDAEIVDMFDCQGELDKTTRRIMSILPDAKLRRWAREDSSQGQPNQTRLNRAREFSVKVMRDIQAAKIVTTARSLAGVR